MFSLDAFHRKYATDISDLEIGNRRFSFFVPKKLDPFLDQDDLFHDFPLWAKIWEASLVLAEYLASRKPDPEAGVLEIGCGLGLVGIVAASFGHRVTLTENNPDALNFVHANALRNLPGTPGRVDIRKLDWNSPGIERTFDLIVGSEIIYSEKDFGPIFRLFKTLSKEGGEIILAEGLRKSSVHFFREMSRHFEMTAQKKIIRTPEKEFRIILCRMRFKDPGRTPVQEPD